MLRALLHYFLIGGLLFGATALYDRRHVEGPTLTVQVAADAPPAVVERAVREAILLNEARRRGWDRKDPVVYTHLVRNMRFIEPDATESDPELYLRALQMNMHRHDPIVRARLLYRANEAMGHVPPDDMPARDELLRHLEENPSEFERPGGVRFWHVFLSGTKRAGRLSADASAMRETLGRTGDGLPDELGDPLPGLSTEQTATSEEVRMEYGDALADALAEGFVGVWRGPIPSVYGVHFINVREVAPSYVPALDDIAPEVREHYLRGVREELRARRMNELLDAYSVEVERLP
jgi:hypothetical protein